MAVQAQIAAPARAEVKPRYDLTLLMVMGTLIALGLLMVFSASYAMAYQAYDDTMYFFTRQVIWTVLGSVALVALSRIDYHLWRRFATPIMGVTLVALAAVLVFGTTRYGAVRHLAAGGSIQPSEPAKIAVIIYIATWVTSKGEKLRRWSDGMLPFVLLLGIVSALIIAQPNFGMAILIVLTAVIMFFVAGADLIQLLLAGAVGASTFGLLINRSSHAATRVKDYLDSLNDPLANGSFQVQQALRALVHGGLFGQGIGHSALKLPGGGLPLPQSDSIFAVLGEEFGLLGTLAVVILFALLAYYGMKVALSAPDEFGSVLAVGITSWLALQAIINVGVISSTLPLTGVPMPFISFGGSSLLTCMSGIGLLISVARSGPQVQGEEKNAGRDLGRRNRGPRVPSVGRSAGPARVMEERVDRAHIRFASKRSTGLFPFRRKQKRRQRER